MAIVIAFFGHVTPVLAQDLPGLVVPPPASDPLFGHSARYYGMPAPAQQEASIRSVLANVGVDQAFLSRSLAAESAGFLVGLLLGGASPPTDLLNSRQDAIGVGERE